MNIGVEIDFSGLDRVMDAVIGYAEGTQIFTDASDIAIPEIREKARSGESFNGSSFAPYADSYKKRREKAGRQTDHVDLTISGGLLNDLHLEGDTILPQKEDIPRAIGLNFGNQHNKMPARPFMGLDKEGLNKLSTGLSGKLQQIIKGSS